MISALLRAAVLIVLAVLGAGAAMAQEAPCADCISVRVGPPQVVRGPFPDELDAPFVALRLADGTMRGFTANSTTYVVDGTSLWDMGGDRRPVMEADVSGSLAECGRWLTSVARTATGLFGMVHQERACQYDKGETDKSMAVATSTDDGLSWTDLGTILTGQDKPTAGTITGEGDCTMVDGRDGYYYAYCLRNTDWQTIAVRAPINAPTQWQKYFEGSWTEPGLGGRATAIGFLGTGTGYLTTQDWVLAVTADPWFGGVRLSVSADKVTFVDLKTPLFPIDGSDWKRPADTDLVAYASIVDPVTGSNDVGDSFVLSFIHVPRGKGFESRYLVQQEVALTVTDTPQAAPVGLALTRWVDGSGKQFVSSTGPLTGDRAGFTPEKTLAYVLTQAPEGVASVKLAECGRGADQMLAMDGACDDGFARERTAGWLYAEDQPGTVPVYLCATDRSHFASTVADCEGRGSKSALLGYGLAP